MRGTLDLAFVAVMALTGADADVVGLEGENENEITRLVLGG